MDGGTRVLSDAEEMFLIEIWRNGLALMRGIYQKLVIEGPSGYRHW